MDRDKAQDAFEKYVLPSIMAAMAGNHLKRQHLHVVTLKPGARYDPTKPLPVLFEYSVGDRREWEWPYDEYARGKVLVTLRTRLSSRDVILTKRHLMEPGDPRYWGSDTIDDVISGASGADQHHDEMIARMTSAAICAEASHYAALYAATDNPPVFLR